MKPREEVEPCDSDTIGKHFIAGSDFLDGAGDVWKEGDEIFVSQSAKG
jgi:hypothetical protein